MGFPDRIERTVPIAHPPEKVRAALATVEMRVERGPATATDLTRPPARLPARQQPSPWPCCPPPAW